MAVLSRATAVPRLHARAAVPVAVAAGVRAIVPAAAPVITAIAATGGIELGGEVFLFSSRRRLREFVQQQKQQLEKQPHLQPQELLQRQFAIAVRRTPALIFALGLEKRFPE